MEVLLLLRFVSFCFIFFIFRLMKNFGAKSAPDEVKSICWIGIVFLCVEWMWMARMIEMLREIYGCDVYRMSVIAAG